MAAVKQNGCALEYVKEQTPEICMTAINIHGFGMFECIDWDIKNQWLAVISDSVNKN